MVLHNLLVKDADREEERDIPARCSGWPRRPENMFAGETLADYKTSVDQIARTCCVEGAQGWGTNADIRRHRRRLQEVVAKSIDNHRDIAEIQTCQRKNGSLGHDYLRDLL